MANPITKVYLLDVPLENDYKNTLYFANASAQQSYFQSKVIGSYSYNDFTYQRKDNIIRIPEIYDNICHCNYVMYQNTNYSNKWFYAFVTDLEYINDGRTDIHIETDVIQTWLFDYNVKASFIEREHVSSDTIGEHTIPENFEKGEYISGGKQTTDISGAHLVISATYDCFNDKDAGSFINGIYHGTDYFLIGTAMAEAGISYFLDTYAKAGKVDSITGMFMVPDELTNFDNITWDYMSQAGGLSYYPYKKLTSEILGLTTAKTMTTKSIYKPYSTINGYTPRNNKLFTYPYIYLLASNNSGANAVYQYELFSTQNCEFTVKGAITPGTSVKMIPSNYKGVAENNEEGLTGGKYPVCSYNTDVYTNWLTQNSVNIGVSLATAGLEIAGGVGMMASGAGAIAGAGAVASGALSIANSVGQIYQHSLVPPQVQGNLNCGDVTYAAGNTDFTFYQMHIKYEYAQIIDKYFDMFGYKVNMVKVPNSNHRSRYWYTKTINVNIDGDIPQRDMQKIKESYNNGITFWRSATDIENYSTANGIV